VSSARMIFTYLEDDAVAAFFRWAAAQRSILEACLSFFQLQAA
jgi:hypothetical protein